MITTRSLWKEDSTMTQKIQVQVTISPPSSKLATGKAKRVSRRWTCPTAYSAARRTPPPQTWTKGTIVVQWWLLRVSPNHWQTPMWEFLKDRVTRLGWKSTATLESSRKNQSRRHALLTCSFSNRTSIRVLSKSLRTQAKTDNQDSKSSRFQRLLGHFARFHNQWLPPSKHIHFSSTVRILTFPKIPSQSQTCCTSL